MRRGGYGDAGGVASGGELPRAAAVAVGSEEQLREEVEAIAAQLQPSVDWTQRVEALVRLEGLALGGAAQFAAFAERLAAARDPLLGQVLERRSAVSRQACHAFAVLAEACGDRMEAVAVQLLPVLLKAIAMGIQVVTDSADACARAVLRHCHTPKVLPRLCGTVAGDKNGRLRQCASSYLLQVLEEWDPSLLDKHADAIESAILAAAQDAQSDTRAAGRLMFAVYGAAWPSAAAAMLQRVDKDKSLQEKLAQALEGRRPGLPHSEGSGSLQSQQSISRRSSFGQSGTQPSTPRGAASASTSASLGPQRLVARPAPVAIPRLALSSLATSGSASPTSSLPSMPSSARLPAVAGGITPRAVRQPPATARVARVDALQASENQRPNGPGSGASTPRGTHSKAPGPAKPSAGRLTSRKSMGGAALRINIAALSQDQGAEEALDTAVPWAAGGPPTGSLSARRVAAPHPPMSARARRPSVLPLGPRPDALTARRVETDQSSVAESSDTSELAPSSSWDDRQPGTSVGQLLGQLSKPGTPWLDKVQLFGALGEVLQNAGSSGPCAEVASNSDRVAACLLDGIGDAHFRVAAAALEALGAGLAGKSAKLFEPQLDRLMPALFIRMVDAKEQLRALADAALAEVPRRHAPEPVLSALARALAAARAPRTKVAVLEFFCTAATGSVDLEDQLEVAPGPALRTLVSAILHLALDKNGDIRRAAARAVSVVYHAGEGSTVVAAVQAVPPAQGAAVQKALAAAVPSLEADLASALRAARPAPVAGAGSAAAPTASSRRHSGEGVLRLPELPLALLAARGGGAASATAPGKPAPAAAPPPRLPGKGAPLASPRCASPRGASPAGRRLGADGSPAGPSPMSRLGRQASSVSASSAAAEADAELSRQPSSCITHTSSPAASAPVSRSASLTLAGSGGLVAAAAPAAAAPATQPSLPLGRAAGSTAPPAPSASVASQQQPGSLPPASMADLAPFDALMDGQLRRLLGQLQPGAPTCEAFQGLSRLAHALPGSAWPTHFSQVLAAVLAALQGGGPLLRESALLLVGDLACAQPELFAGALPALLPRVLDCMGDASREVVVAADDALAQLLGGLPPQPSLALLVPGLPSEGLPLSADPVAAGQLYGVLKCLRRVAARLAPADAQQALASNLLPGLCAAYCSPIADVRKATVDCLVELWLVLGNELPPHLARLSPSQMRLLTIYHDRAQAQRSRG